MGLPLILPRLHGLCITALITVIITVSPSPEARIRAQNDFLWPGGVVPYSFSKAFNKNQHERMLVLKAMEGFENSTCIRFIQRTTEADYLQIVAHPIS
ncbi:hypothetical protein BV898_12196 [Hypsibius exemplaris]|uniref:Peptidase M12A domain-containing protein n=1 Tax=Hypsibius exemplaris TaxID=2072580 RepID=A0A1W0WEE1_HYPEX|nr:hypothetical protein BV898_12196 [Hypsibius exemplaris]